MMEAVKPGGMTIAAANSSASTLAKASAGVIQQVRGNQLVEVGGLEHFHHGLTQFALSWFTMATGISRDAGVI